MNIPWQRLGGGQQGAVLCWKSEFDEVEQKEIENQKDGSEVEVGG
jgi:hypothetical protein